MKNTAKQQGGPRNVGYREREMKLGDIYCIVNQVQFLYIDTHA